MSLGSKARLLRKSKYMTLQDISDITKLSIDTISKFERCKSNYTADTLIKILKALDTTFEELMK